MLNNLIRKGLTLTLLIVSQTSLAKTITVSHPMGETTLETKPQRVIVLGMDTLDVLDALEIEPIGVVKAPIPGYLSKYQANEYASVGSLFEPDFETIYTLKPDLIIVSNRSSESFAELSEIAPSVLFMADPVRYWETSTAAWRMLGRIFEKEEVVESFISAQEAQVKAIKSKISSTKPNVLVVMKNGGNLTAFGAKSRYSAVFDIFGFREATANDKNFRHGDLISFEYIADADPDYMFVLDRDAAIARSSQTAQDRFDNPLINNLPVYKNGHIRYLNSAAWYISASGIQATQLMIDDVSAALEE